MKLQIILLLTLTVCQFGYSQRSDTTYFSIKDGQVIITGKDSAEFYQLSLTPKFTGLNIEYYIDGTKRGEELFVEGRRSGPYVIFYRNGKVKERGTYDSGWKNGAIQTWYSNGQKKQVIEYHSETNLVKMKIISAWDSLGNIQVENGNGYFSGFSYESYGVREEGEFKLGLRLGKWNGYKENRLYYQEEYANGEELIKGISYDHNGKEFAYNHVEEQAAYPGGHEAWNKYLKKSLKYPKLARRRGIQGNVFASFIVNKDGSTEDIQIVRGIGGGCDDETSRILKESLNWAPGKQRGQLVKSRMSIQIVFRLR